MSASVLVSLMVVIIAFVLFFFLSFRGVNLFLTVFACTVLVCLCTPDGLTSISVSYTHLDVYKRQAYSRNTRSGCLP